MTVIDCQL